MNTAKWSKSVIGMGLILSSSLLANSVMDDEVKRELNTSKKIKVIVHLKEQYDLSKFDGSKFKNQAERGRALATVLENYTKESVNKAFPFLTTDAGVEEVTPIWLTNSVRVVAPSEVISKLQTWSDSSIDSIQLDKPKHIEEMEEPGSTLFTSGTHWDAPQIAWGVEKLRAPELWAQGIDGRGVIVAMIDSGANIKHPDLAPNIWNNPGETGTDDNGKDKATNGVDDDQNGFIDDVHGWNSEKKSGDVSDNNGHGSQTAGIVGGMGAGGTQTGVAPKATLMIIRACCDLGGSTAESAIMEGMQYAVKNGAQAISMSLSIKHYSNPAYAKWRRASEAVLAGGVVHINSAGNRGTGNEPNNIGAPASNPPAWYHSSQTQSVSQTSMITIGATDENDKLRYYSSVGPVSWESIPEFKDFPFEKGKKPGLLKPEVCGPSEVPTTSMDGKSYTSGFGGTSSATPHIGGVAALLLSYKKDLTVAQITEALQMSAIEVESKFNNKCGSGRVDAVQAVEYVKSHFDNKDTKSVSKKKRITR